MADGVRDALDLLLRERRLLLAAPAGGGLARIEEPAARCLVGPILVVSGGADAARRRVRRLCARGPGAVFLGRRSPRDALAARLAEVERGRCRVLHVEPERLCASGSWERIRALRPALVVLEEAHRASRLGFDFHVAHAAAASRIRSLDAPRLLAVSGSAAPEVCRELCARLGLRAGAPVRAMGFAPANVSLRVCELRRGSARRSAAASFLEEELGQPPGARGAAVVHALHARAAEIEATRLAARGWRAAAHHPALPTRLRRRVAGAFRSGVLDVVVTAGVRPGELERSDVRAAVHLAAPASLEAYAEHLAAVGRDGLDAAALLVPSPGELAWRRARLERLAAAGLCDPEALARDWQRFLALMRWAEASSCRRRGLLRHFREWDEQPDGCGRCDVCGAPVRAARRARSSASDVSHHLSASKNDAFRARIP